MASKSVETFEEKYEIEDEVIGSVRYLMLRLIGLLVSCEEMPS